MSLSPARGFAMVAVVTLTGCAALLPTASPTASDIMLELFATDSTARIVQTLAQDYQTLTSSADWELTQSNHAALLAQLQTGTIAQFITSQLPTDLPDNWTVTPIAQDALVMIVNKANPLVGLSLDELRRVYLGNIATWQDITGKEAGVITLYSREDGADTRAEFERLVMGNRRTSPNARVEASAAATIQRVREDSSAIGYVPLSLLSSDVRALAIEGVLPTLTTLQDATYPLRSTLYAISSSAITPPQTDLLTWIQSDDGQALLAQIAAPLPR